MHERFFDVFKSHDIPTADIPALLKDYNIKLSTLADNGRLLNAYTPQVVEAISDMFGVEKNWLMGYSNSTYKYFHHWYKDNHSFCSRLLKLKNKGLKVHVYYIKKSNYSLDDIESEDKKYNPNENILILVQTVNHYGTNKEYSSYQIHEHGRWGYWRSRYQLKAIALFCYLMKIQISGYSVSETQWKYLNDESALFATKRSKLRVIDWHPDDYIDGFEKDNPYPTSKQLHEVESVFDMFLSEGLGRLVNEHINTKSISSNNIRIDYFNTIQSFETEEKQKIIDKLHACTA